MDKGYEGLAVEKVLTQAMGLGVGTRADNKRGRGVGDGRKVGE